MTSFYRPQTLSRLSVSNKPIRVATTCVCIRRQQRNASTAKRHRKLHNVGPAPFFGGPSTTPTGGTGRSKQPKRDSLPEFDHIVFNPPSASPNVYHTPVKFMPKSDPRRQSSLGPIAQSAEVDKTTDMLGVGSTTASTAKVGTPVDETTGSIGEGEVWEDLPPAVRTPYEKSYHLGEKEIEEIRKLRSENERYWTRIKLAEKFQCSQLFVGMIVQASEQRLKKMNAAKEARTNRLGRRATIAREERTKRKAMWQRDE